MGNDGGSIPTRRELVKSAPTAPTASQLKASLQERLSYAWSTCPLSRTPLRPPIVSDSGGNLYNKDAVLQFLLSSEDGEAEDAERKDREEVLGGRVKGLKDVVEVIFEERQERESGAANGNGNGGEEGRWVCTVTGKVLGATVRGVYLVPCGHAFSEEGIKETRGGEGNEEEKCLQCNTPYLARDIIPILPFLESDKQRLDHRAVDLSAQSLSHSLRKTKSKDKGESKKRKKDKLKDEELSHPSPHSHTNGSTHLQDTPSHLPLNLNSDPIPRSKTSTPQPPPPRSGTSTPVPSGIKNAATASLTARVLEEEAQKAKRRKMGAGNDNLKSLFTSSVEKDGRVKDGEFMTRGFSMAAKGR